MNILTISLLLFFNIASSAMNINIDGIAIRESVRSTYIGDIADSYARGEINFVEEIDLSIARPEINKLFKNGEGNQIQSLVNKALNTLEQAKQNNPAMANHIEVVRGRLVNVQTYISWKVDCEEKKRTAT